MKIAAILAPLIALILLSPVDGHSGRTNASGCHNNRQTGGYHCHNSRPPESETINGDTAPSLSDIAVGAWSVVSVSDGDTIRVRQANNTITVRLACIDAPEIAQAPYGANARSRLQALLPFGSTVRLNPVDKDRYGRIMAETFRQNSNINLALVQEGAAVAYRQYLSNCDSDQYLASEIYARQNQLGFWAQPNPVMPWDYRRQN
ncbi:MAG: thermonuclease family protein [Verrucomicrobiota bacterium]